jgi:hypothetical protein
MQKITLNNSRFSKVWGKFNILINYDNLNILAQADDNSLKLKNKLENSTYLIFNIAQGYSDSINKEEDKEKLIQVLRIFINSYKEYNNQYNNLIIKDRN